MFYLYLIKTQYIFVYRLIEIFMKQISVTEYAKLNKITRGGVFKRINTSLKNGSNKLKDGSIFAKIGHNYIIEIDE
jgi:hypothetical protein